MLIGFCNTKRSVALMLLMVVCSNAQQIQNPSADTDCPVERLDLESHLASLEAQLNNVQRIVSTLNNPLIKEDCTVNLASFGYDDSTKYGYIRTSGGSSLDIYVHGQHHRYRGVNLVELDATTCKVRRKHHFDTHSNADDRVQFLEALESATTGSIIVGVTADTPENEDNFAFKNIAASFFRRYGMTLTGQLFREKFAFILQKGYPKKTLFRKSPRYGESLRLSVALSGSTVSDVWFSLVR